MLGQASRASVVTLGNGNCCAESANKLLDQYPKQNYPTLPKALWTEASIIAAHEHRAADEKQKAPAQAVKRVRDAIVVSFLGGSQCPRARRGRAFLFASLASSLADVAISELGCWGVLWSMRRVARCGFVGRTEACCDRRSQTCGPRGTNMSIVLAMLVGLVTVGVKLLPMLMGLVGIGLSSNYVSDGGVGEKPETCVGSLYVRLCACVCSLPKDALKPPARLPSLALRAM